MNYFPLVSLVLGALITVGGLATGNKEGVIAGSGFLAAAGTAFQVQAEVQVKTKANTRTKSKAKTTSTSTRKRPALTQSSDTPEV